VSLLGIIIVVFVVLALIMFIGGFIVAGRRQRARAADLQSKIEAADQALAAARAGDRGWDLELIETAARDAFAQRSGGREPDRLHIVQVIDRPGTDEDECIVRAGHGHHEEDVVLGRQGGQWVAR
jgi:type II secretory pathway pseudopilin PulG